MPITPEEQRRRLLAAGLNPDDYEVLSKSDYEARNASKLNVVGTKLAEQGGALAGGAAAATAASPLLMASAGPQAFVTIPAYIGAVLLGSYLGKKGQELGEGALLDEKYKKQLDEYRQSLNTERPALSTATELGSQLLVGRPSPKVLAKAGSGLGKLALGAGKLERTLNPAEIRALTATGAGAVLGGGVEGANQIVQGEFDPGRLAAQTAIGAVATEPTMLTKLFGGFAAKVGNKITGKSIFAAPEATDINDVARELPAVLHVDNEGKIVPGIKKAPVVEGEVGAEAIPAGKTTENLPDALNVDPNGKEEFNTALKTFRNDLTENGYEAVTTESGEHFLAPDAAADYKARVANGEAPDAALTAAIEFGHKNPIEKALAEIRARTEEPAPDIFEAERGEVSSANEAARAQQLERERLSGFGPLAREVASERISAQDAEAAKVLEQLKGAKAIKGDINVTPRLNEIVRELRKDFPGKNLREIVASAKEGGGDKAIRARLGGEQGQPGKPYGYWLDRHGNLIPVKPYGHDKAAIDILGKDRNLDENLYDQLYNKGYTRLVFTDNKLLGAATNRLTPAQEKIVRQLREDYNTPATITNPDIYKQIFEQAQPAGEGSSIDPYTRQFALSRGLDIAQAAEPLSLASDPNTPLAGKTFAAGTEAANKGIVGVDPANARPDTAAHELLHTTVRALGALAANGDKQAGRVYDAIAKAAGGEEAIVQAGGEKLAKILQNGEQGASALGLLQNSLRFRLGGDVTPERLSTYLANLARSTGADIGSLSQLPTGAEQGASVLPKNIDPLYAEAEEKGITFGSIYNRAAATLDSPIQKLDIIGRNTPEQAAVTDYAKPRLENMLTEAKRIQGRFDTALQSLRFGDKVTDFLMSGLPFGRKLANALGRGYTEAEESLVNLAMIAKDKLHTLVPEGTTTELSLETPESQQYLLDALRKVEADPRLKRFLDQIQTDVLIPLQQLAIDSGVLIYDNGKYRMPRIQGDYNPNKMNSELIYDLTHNPGEAKATKIKDLIYDYWLKRDISKAQESGLSGSELDEFVIDANKEVKKDFDNMIKAWSGAIPAGSPQSFAALSRAAGRGLPVSLIEPNLESRLSSHIRRSAVHLSYVRNIETDPVMRTIVDIPDQTGSKDTNLPFLPDGTIIDKDSNAIVHSDALGSILNGYADYPTTVESLIKTVSRLATSSWMGALSGARDLASSVVRDFAYVPIQEIPSLYANSVKDFAKFFTESFETGVNKSRHSQIEFGENTLNTGLDTINKFSDALSQAQGRDVLEKIARGWAYAKGRHLADLIQALPEGKSPVLDRLWRLLSAETPGLKDLRGKPEFNELAKKELAARYTESIQGTYDLKNLPAISQKGPLSLAFTLQRWNVEMMNRFRREMVEPVVKTGRAWNKDKTNENFAKFQAELQPLVQYTLAAALGGVGIKEMTQLITNKLAEQPTNEELKATGHEVANFTDPQVMSKWIGNLEMAGYGGFLGQTVSTVVNSLLATPGRGDFGSLPTYEFAASTAGTLRDFITSVETPEDVVEKLPLLAHQLARNNLQNYRSVMGYARDDESEMADAKRNQRVFGRLTGENIPAPQKGNPFSDVENKNLDLARTPEEAKAALEAVVNKAKLRIANSPDPRATAATELRKIKLPAKSFFPSAESPKLIAFIKYLQETGKLQPQLEQEAGRRRNMALTGR